MPAHRTLAFVLRTQDYRDTSLLAAFYTRDFGKIRGIVKGGREARLRYGSTLEPFSMNEILFYDRRRTELVLVTSVELVERFEPLRRDLEKLGLAAYLTELVDQMTDAAGSPELFEALRETLEAMAAGADSRRAARVFEVKLLRATGHMPRTDACVRCGETHGLSLFSVASGGPLCAACRRGEGALVPVTPGVLAFLARAAEGAVAEAARGPLDTETGERLERLLRQFVDHHLVSRPRALAFLEKVGEPI
jgi:DNA repair protein RecO (recombination protein O)